MRKSISIFLVAFAITSVNESAQAQEALPPEKTGANQFTTEPSNGWSLSMGLGVSSLKLDYEGDTKSAESFLLRIDKADASNNYALQYSSYSNLASPLDAMGDFFDDFIRCLLSFSDECDEKFNTTTVEDLSFLYGWRNNEDIYSVGLSHVRSDNTVKKRDDYSTVGVVVNVRKKLSENFDWILHVNKNEEDSFAALYFSVRFD